MYKSSDLGDRIVWQWRVVSVAKAEQMITYCYVQLDISEAGIGRHTLSFHPIVPWIGFGVGETIFHVDFPSKILAKVGISIYRLVFVIGQINTNPIITPQPSKPISNGDPTMILLQFPEYFPLWKKLGLRLQFVPFWCILNDAVGGGEGGWWEVLSCWLSHGKNTERGKAESKPHIFIFTPPTHSLYLSHKGFPNTKSYIFLQQVSSAAGCGGGRFLRRRRNRRRERRRRRGGGLQRLVIFQGKGHTQ